jgi:hypothetical protein
VSARFRLLFYGVSSKNVLSAVVSFSLLSVWNWLFTPVSIFTLLSSVSSGSVPRSSLFLLYVERKVLGACQNHHCIVSFSPFLLDVQRKVIGACQIRLRVSLSSPFHSFLFGKRSCWLSQSLLYCLSTVSTGSALVSFSPVISTNVLGA